MYYIELAFLLVWVGALCTYLSSQHQRLLTTSLPKNLCWSVLTISIALSTYLLSMAFAVVASFLFSVGILLLSWICIIFISGHWKIKLPILASTGVVSWFLLAQMVGV